jgi:YVTN family beta-propeller protein
MYISNEDDSLVTVVDVAKKKIINEIKVGVEPEGIATSADDQWIASASETTNMVHWIDKKSQSIVDNTLVDPRPRYLTFTPDSQQLWVSSEMAGTVMILDVHSRQLIKTIHFDIPGVANDKIQPVGIAIDKNRTHAYIALGSANRIAVINCADISG